MVKELKELGFSDEELEEAGFSRRAVEAVDGRPVRELKDYGYEVAELKEYGAQPRTRRSHPPGVRSVLRAPRRSPHRVGVLRLDCASAPSRPSPGQPLANLSPPRLGEALRLPPLLPACSLLAGRTIVPAAARPGGRASCCEERLISVLSPVSRSETTGGWPTVRRSSPPRAPTHAVAAAVATPSHRRRFLFAAGADVQTELPRVHHSASGAAAAPCAAADASSARRLRPSHVWLLDRCVVIADTLEEAAPLFARARARRLPVADLRWLKTMLMRQRYRDPRPAPA